MEQGLVSLNNSTSTPPPASTSPSNSRIDHQITDDNPSPVAAVVVVAPSDDVMDLLRAIEMSRLQAVRENEQNIYRPNTNNTLISNTNDKMEYFNDLQQAIELSLRTKTNEHLSTDDITSLFSYYLFYFIETFPFSSMYTISTR